MLEAPLVRCRCEMRYWWCSVNAVLRHWGDTGKVGMRSGAPAGLFVLPVELHHSGVVIEPPRLEAVHHGLDT